MQELEPTWGRVMSVWWLLAWRTMVGAFVLGAVVGGVFGFFAALANWSADTLQMGSTVLGGVMGVIWGFFVVGMALKKRHSNFRIGPVPVTTA